MALQGLSIEARDNRVLSTFEEGALRIFASGIGGGVPVRPADLRLRTGSIGIAYRSNLIERPPVCYGLFLMLLNEMVCKSLFVG